MPRQRLPFEDDTAPNPQSRPASLASQSQQLGCNPLPTNLLEESILRDFISKLPPGCKALHQHNFGKWNGYTMNVETMPGKIDWQVKPLCRTTACDRMVAIPFSMAEDFLRWYQENRTQESHE